VIRGVLFDLDGVLADTERLQWNAYRVALLEYGVDVGLEEYRREWIRSGFGPEYACRQYRLPIAPDELRARKAPHYQALLQTRVAPMPGAVEALRRLRDTHRLALATNTGRDDTAFILERLGIATLLHAAVVREDYAEPKPAPDAYLAAARLLGLPPAECVVIEDTERGTRAGLAAGMRVIAAPSDLTFDNDFTGCIHRLRSLDDLTPELLLALP
jgi:HAD superfamily hydrolase (TIGR01509 family)